VQQTTQVGVHHCLSNYVLMKSTVEGVAWCREQTAENECRPPANGGMN